MKSGHTVVGERERIVRCCSTNFNLNHRPYCCLIAQEMESGITATYNVEKVKASGFIVISAIYTAGTVHREMKQRSSRTMVLQKTTHSPHGTTQN